MTSVAAPRAVNVRQSARPSENWVLDVPLNGADDGQLQHAVWTERGSVRAFLHGELVNREDLSPSAKNPSESESDAALVLHVYEQGGEAALSRLRGSFAVVVCDRGTGRTIVARDPLGAHPLFYAQRGSSVSFATHPRLLLAQPGVSRDLNGAAIADHLCSRWPDNQETFFQAVRRIPPGWRAVVGAGRIKLDRYWDPVPHYDRPIDWLPAEDAERFTDVLDVAVRRCLRFGPTGVFLSGGFDSVSIAAVASDQAHQIGVEAPRALSLAFPHPECDERDRQTGVARTLGLRQELVDFDEAAGPRGLLGEGLILNEGLASPLFNSWAPAYIGLARRAERQGVRTIMTGSGGDEWLGVSPYLGADLLRRGDLAGFVRFARTWSRSYDQTAPQLLRAALWTFGLRPLGGMMMSRLNSARWDKGRLDRGHRSDPAWVAPGTLLRTDLRHRAVAGLAEADPPGGFYARESRAFIDHSLMSRDLEEQYEFGQRLGVRFMHPYWDPDLAAHIYRTPPELLMKGGRAKGLVRETVARRFPGLGFERQRKVSALSYFRSIVAAQGPVVAQSVGPFRALAAIGVVDPDGARAFVEDGFRRQTRPMLAACQLFNLEMWARDYVN